MKNLSKIPFWSLLFLFIFSCKVQNFDSPTYGNFIAKESIQLKKVSNFRAIEKIKNRDGKTLLAGRFYRSADFHTLRKRSFKDFEKLGIKKVIDLRNSKELAQKPDQLPSQVVYKNYSAFEDKGDQLNQARKLVLKGRVNATDADNRMLDFYREYATKNPQIIKEIISEILDSEQPVVIHCSAGKDRTGIITALILTILKFDKETIYNDYLLSNNFRNKSIQKRLRLARNLHFLYPRMDLKVLEKLSWVEPTYLDSTFEEIDVKYGSIEIYIEQILGISHQKREEYIRKFTQ